MRVRRFRDSSVQGEGHDSFLDIVANLVGVLIILVMVVAVRARDGAVDEQRAQTSSLEPVDVESARFEAEGIREDIQRIEQLLQRQAMEIAYREKERDKVFQELRVLELLVQQQESHLDTSQQEKLQKQAMLGDLKHQLEDLEQARRTVEQMQSQPEVIQHRPTPMAKTVFGTEIHFRLFQGRITYIPWDQLIERLKQDAQQKARNLSGEGKLTELIGPIGGFRMRYQLGVRRYLANTTDGPRMRQGLQLEQFELIPVDPTMGEGVASAMEEGSRFLQTLGSFSSQRTTVTIWVYPESFIQFQQIKTLLHQRGFACAGRPLPAGALISGSPSGSLSAAQ
jgi:cell division protein FtsN